VCAYTYICTYVSETAVGGSLTKDSADYSATSSGGVAVVKFGPMSLLNALSACVMSARLRAEYRQWALQQVVSGMHRCHSLLPVCCL